MPSRVVVSPETPVTKGRGTCAARRKGGEQRKHLFCTLKRHVGVLDPSASKREENVRPTEPIPTRGGADRTVEHPMYLLVARIGIPILWKTEAHVIGHRFTWDESGSRDDFGHQLFLGINERYGDVARDPTSDVLNAKGDGVGVVRSRVVVSGVETHGIENQLGSLMVSSEKRAYRPRADADDERENESQPGEVLALPLSRVEPRRNRKGHAAQRRNHEAGPRAGPTGRALDARQG
jgi:hypothetical protein